MVDEAIFVADIAVRSALRRCVFPAGIDADDLQDMKQVALVTAWKYIGQKGKKYAYMAAFAEIRRWYNWWYYEQRYRQHPKLKCPYDDARITHDPMRQDVAIDGDFRLSNERRAKLAKILLGQRKQVGRKGFASVTRMIQVLEWVCSGYSNDNIAMLAGVSVKTVESWRYRTRKKLERYLEATNRTVACANDNT